MLLPGGGGVRGVERDHRLAGDRRVHVVVVAHVQHVFLLQVFKEEEEPLLLQQAGDEAPVRLPVLHAVLTGGRRLAALEVKLVLHLAVRQHLVDDLLDVLFLEDAAVGAVLEAPGQRHDGGLVHGEAAPLVPQLEGSHQAVDIPRAPGSGQGQHGHAAHHLVEGHVSRVCGQHQVEAEEPRDLLLPLELQHVEILGQLQPLYGEADQHVV